jgi:hypothetical protein
MLHPPYTLMVLSFAAVGAVLAPTISLLVLGATLAAYFLGLGVGAHFLDQLPGMGSRYVRHWPSWALWAGGLGGVAAGVGIGVLGAWVRLGPPFLAWVLVQGLCALGYPLAPVFRGVFHRDSVFAVSWGSLPFLTSYYAQSGTISLAALAVAAVFAGAAVVEIRMSRWSRRARKGVPAPGGGLTPRLPSRVPDRVLQILSVGTTVVAFGLLAARLLAGS